MTESCEEQCDGFLSVACQPKTSSLQLGSLFQMGDYHLTGIQEREKSNGERERGGVKAIQREVFSPATCSSEGLGGLPRAAIESLNENWTYKADLNCVGAEC